MSRLLCLDVGEKRIGAALTDETRTIASPYKVLDAKNYEKEIQEILDTNDIDMIIVGLPRNMDGSIGKKAEEIMGFGEKIKDLFGKRIEYEDETGTSLAAKDRLKERGVNFHKNKGEVDLEAAVIILESYLERKNAK